MLKMMRENLKSLSWVLAFVVAAFIFALFADWGGKGNWVGGPSGQWAAQVEGTSIPIRDWLTTARNLSNYYRSLLGDQYNPSALQATISQQALNQLVQEEIILAHARSLGLRATPAEVRDQLIRAPELQGANGFIGVDRYKSLLQANGIETADFEEDLARRVLQQKWAELLTADITVTDEQVAREIRRKEESADLLYARFRADDFRDGIELTDGETESFYAENQDRYLRGETREFDMVIFDRLREQQEIQIAEDEARTRYEASMQSRFTIPAQRRASHILIKTQDGASDTEYQAARQRAVDALTRVRAGEDFAEVAREVSEDTSAANGGDLGFFQRGVMAIPFEESVWSMEQVGAVSDVVQTQFGYHVILLTDIQEARVKDFEEAREEIEREIAFERSGDLVLQKAEEFATAIAAAPESFRDEAALRTLVASNPGAIHEDDPVPGVGYNPEVQRALFALQTGEASDPIAIPRGYIVARFLQSAPGGAPPLEEIRDQVTGDLRGERAADAARRQAELAAGATSAEDLRARSEELGFTVDVAAGVSRGLAIGTLGTDPVLEEAIFRAEIGQVAGPLELPDGPVVFVVSSRKEVTDEDLATRAPAVRDELVNGRRQQRLASVTRELVETADVVYNAELLEEINSMSGAAAPATPGS